ncbi:MAG: aminodeoxychorismate synthase component I [Sphingobacteriales bacterium]|nr:MAG: aminodeoxychorismate synthase component I [Sphingobacteriales bacterium]
MFKQKALQWAATFAVSAYLDSNSYSDKHKKYDLILAVGSRAQISLRSGQAFDGLKLFYDDHKSWIFGLLAYELKNEIEHLNSRNTDNLLFPELFFFVPQHLIVIKNNDIEVVLGDKNIVDLINHTTLREQRSSKVNIQSRISKESYLDTVEKLRQHIIRGDIYEVNFCQEFFAEHAMINPLAVYRKLNQISPTPFSGFFKINDQYILSASPERFLCKRGNKLISQPIKGTAKRSPDPEEDQLIKTRLHQDAKEQAENVMIVDLVRNDLTRSAMKGSVQVDELFGIYGFAQVYQMVSTVSCQIDPQLHIVDAIRNTFPMGSMTGAPKIKAMELIEKYEASRRGAYSGAFGYINPEGDFDFNVIIRTICYDASKQYLSFQVGGAITFASNAHDEYEECLLKASAIMQTLRN